MKFILQILSVLLLITYHAAASDFQEELNIKAANSDPKVVMKFIKDSYARNNTNPAYYIASANFYWDLSQQPYISSKPTAEGDFAVTDTKSSKEVGSISTTGLANPELPIRAVELLKEAFQRFPNRVDIGIGLAYLYREENDQKGCLSTLETLLNNAATNPTQLRWKDGAELPEAPNTFIPEQLQDYTAGFYQLENKEGDKYCRELCGLIIKVYPDHPFAYNILAALSSDEKDNASCLRYLLIAHEKAPTDTLIIMNLADFYKRTGDKASAKKYYKLALVNSPPADTKEQAEQALKELN